ncbi:MAG: ZIP family metal transporter, partial [Planctomycetes bacterium]|nr:ZIP family metal transporter [Planctomycetota bacterium]
MDERLLLFIALLFAASLIGMLPPLVRRWSDRGLHNFVAASAGIFLGTVFLHLLPELAGGDSHGHAHVHASVDSSMPWAAALVGFLGLFLIEKVWMRGKPGADGHTLVWVSTYVGLSVHAFTAGLGLAALLEHPELSVAVVAILWHKLTECFSLSSVMRLAGAPAKRHFAMLGLFACITPAGLLIGAQLAGIDAHANAALTGLAAGTFLYVAVCDLLPEVFHHFDRRTPRVIALVAGVVASALAPEFESFDALIASCRHFGDEALATFLAMAPYLLLGFAVAGLVQVFLEPAALQRWLKGEGAKPIATASVLGAPLPLCSCSVIPVASGLRKAGAGKGPTSAFLIATPETGVDSVSVTWALFDPVMAVVRPVASVLSALVTGLAVGLFAKSANDDEPNAGLDAAVANPCCSNAEEAEGTHVHDET